MKQLTSKIMSQVLYALIPAIAVMFYYYGFGVLIQIILAIFACVFFEYAVLVIRKKPKHIISQHLGDGSAVITAVLLGLALPSIAPWWLIILGSFFAIVLGKQLYGGLGHNPFNPAMLGYAFLLISLPLHMSTWQGLFFMGFADAVEVIFIGLDVDAISSATRLEQTRITDFSQTYINLAFLLGGFYMLWKKVIFWQIPVSLLLSITIFATLFNLLEDNNFDFYFHLTSGATMMAAFFIATDPVSASTTLKGRIIYGFLIGFLIMIIRTFGNYPDGVAFAILLANITVPLIDYYTKPKILGQ